MFSIGVHAHVPVLVLAENYATKTAEAIKQTHAALNRHPNFSRLLFVAETKGELVVVEEYCRQSLRSYIRMCSSLLREHHPGRSGGKSSMDIRVRFIFYQLLKAVKFLHDQGLCTDALASDRIHIDSLGWITLPPALGVRTAECAERCAMLLQHAVPAPAIGPRRASGDAAVAARSADAPAGPTTSIDEIRPFLVDWMKENKKRGKRIEHVERPPGYYEPLTLRWLKGQVCLMRTHALSSRLLRLHVRRFCVYVLHAL
jgi:serine/threonine protein kinase